MTNSNSPLLKPLVASNVIVTCSVAALLFVLYTRLSDLPAFDRAPVSPTQLVVALIALLVVARLLFVRGARLQFDRVLLAMLAYAAAIALSSLFAIDRYVSLAALAQYLREILIVFALLNLVTSTTALRLATWAIVAAAAFLAAATLLQAATGFDLGGVGSSSAQLGSTGTSVRLDGPVYLDSNYFAQILVAAFPLALYRAWDERQRILRWTALPIVTLLGGVVVFSFSRGGLLALLTVIACSAASRLRQPRHVLLLAVALFPVLLAAPSIYWNRLGLTFVNARLLADSQPVGGESAAGPSALPAPSPNAAGPASASAPTPPQAAAPAAAPATAAAPQPTPAAAAPLGAVERARSSDSIFTRIGVLNVTFEVFRLHPLTGVGKENFHQAYSQNVQRVDPALPVGPLSPHNTPLHVAAETGLLGLSCFVAILVLTLLGLRQARRLAISRGLAQEASLLQAIELSIYGYLVASLFLSDTIYQRYLWLLVALAAAGRQIVLERGAAGAD